MHKPTRQAATTITVALFFSLCGILQANKYGSVEPIANAAVIDTAPLSRQPLKGQEAFPTPLLQWGIVNQVGKPLSSTPAIHNH